MEKSVSTTPRKTQKLDVVLKTSRRQKINKEEKLRSDLAISTAPPDSPSGPIEPAQSDFQVYVPSQIDGPDSTNQHITVIPLATGELFATWTMGSLEGADDQHIVVSRSSDRGLTWTKPEYFAGSEDDGFIASWSFPFVVPSTRRIYMFYHKNVGFNDPDPQVSSQLWYRVSDDNGHTWSKAYTHLRLEKNSYSHKDIDAAPNWIIYQPPIITHRGEVLVGLTHTATKSMTINGHCPSEVRFIIFNNILNITDPANMTISTYPINGADGLRMDHPDYPGQSFLQEPSVQCLSDGRLFCVMRTAIGYAAYSISCDHGHTWSEPDILRYCENGDPIKQPMAPCPLYKLRDQRYVLIFHNNIGDANQGRHFMDWCRNRRPVYLTVGREVLHNEKQPLIFKAPKVISDNSGVPISRKQLTEIGTYPSLFEYGEKVYFIYPDRKHYILGKILSEESLCDYGLPR